MAKLKITKNHQFVQEIILDPDQTYLAGRAQSCQIKMDAEPGISRQHFQISIKDGVWKLEVLSQYGELYIQEQKAPAEVALNEGLRFQVPPYEFTFGEGSIKNEIEKTQTMVNSENGDGDDKTQIAVLPTSFYLKLIDDKGSVRQLFRLEGEAWVGGRDVTCSIFIDNPRVSRKQFEIYREGQRFFIRDFGSANGTTVNGHQISTTDWTEIHSSDIISVVNWTLQFEVHDSQFKDKVEGLPSTKVDIAAGQASDYSSENDEFLPTNYSPIPTPDLNSPQYQQTQDQQYYIPVPGYNPQDMGSGMGGMAGMPPQAPKNKWEEIKSKLNPVRVAIILIVVVALGYGLFSDDSGSTDSTKVSKSKNPFDLLSPEDQQYVIQCYTAADQYIRQQLYQNALDEIIKLEAKVKYYQDSKAIKEVAQSALATIAAQQEEEKLQKEKAEMDLKIQRQTAECEKQMNPDTIDLAQLDNCLSPVLTLNPDHELIISLKRKVDQIVAEREQRKAQKKIYEEELKKLQLLFSKAESHEKKEDLKEALRLYESIFKQGSNIESMKAKARKKIDHLKKRIDTDLVAYVEKAEQAMRESKFKDAVIFLQKANRLSPDNEKIKIKLNQASTELHKLMQVIFQDAILEESVGDVEAAKIKWRRVMDQSLPSEEYYEKARLKLRKYGVI